MPPRSACFLSLFPTHIRGRLIDALRQQGSQELVPASSHARQEAASWRSKTRRREAMCPLLLLCSGCGAAWGGGITQATLIDTLGWLCALTSSCDQSATARHGLSRAPRQAHVAVAIRRAARPIERSSHTQKGPVAASVTAYSRPPVGYASIAPGQGRRRHRPWPIDRSIGARCWRKEGIDRPTRPKEGKGQQQRRTL